MISFKWLLKPRFAPAMPCKTQVAESVHERGLGVPLTYQFGKNPQTYKKLRRAPCTRHPAAKRYRTSVIVILSHFWNLGIWPNGFFFRRDSGSVREPKLWHNRGRHLLKMGGNIGLDGLRYGTPHWHWHLVAHRFSALLGKDSKTVTTGFVHLGGYPLNPLTYLKKIFNR